METGILQVTVIKGPSKGQTLVCKPGSKLQIGRVIKGNDFAVRDPGISQKHLCFQFLLEASRWFVSDLDSSNGTILNGSKIQSLVPVPISDSDVIKIGERTELGVKIVSPVLLKENEDEIGHVKGRRVNTRRGLARGLEVEEVKEDESRVSVPVRGRRNNAPANLARVSDEEEKKEKTLDPDFAFDLGAKTADKGKGRGRRRKDANENSNSILEKKMEENRDVIILSSAEAEKPDQSRGVKLRRNPRRGNPSRVLKELDMNCAVNVGFEAEGVRMKRKGRGNGEQTRVPNDEMSNISETLLLETENENCDSCFVVNSDEGKGFKARTNVSSSMVTEEKKGEEDFALEDSLEINQEEVGNHFEKMTLEQWFDSMEVFLPKAIRDEAEEIKRMLKEKAKKFDEFIEAGGNV